LCGKALGGKKVDFLLREGVAPWPQGQKNLNGWQSYRRNYELRITSKKYSNEKTHQLIKKSSQYKCATHQNQKKRKIEQ